MKPCERRKLYAELRAMRKIVIALAPLPKQKQQAILNLLTVKYFGLTLEEFLGQRVA